MPRSLLLAGLMVCLLLPASASAIGFGGSPGTGPAWTPPYNIPPEPPPPLPYPPALPMMPAMPVMPALPPVPYLPALPNLPVGLPPLPIPPPPPFSPWGQGPCW